MPTQQLFDKHGGYFGSVSVSDEILPDARITQINLMPCLGRNSADALWHDVLHHLHELNRQIDDAWKNKKPA